ncbi:MAG TPA: hypothetical protein VGK92_12015, partial [Gaiellales bacterium]
MAAARGEHAGLAAAPWLAIGLALPALAGSGALGRALVVLALVVLAWRVRGLATPAAAAVLCCIAGGALWSAHGVAQRAADPLAVRSGQLSRVRLVVDGQPRPGPFGSTAIAQLDGHPLELRSRGDLRQGTVVEVSGTLAAVPPSDDGFDRRTWLARQGVHESLSARELTVVGRRGGLAGLLDRLRAGAHAALLADGGGTATQIATGVALGGSSALDDATVEDFRAS